jgi:folate-binding Fe-S cluster repair protein YgfZ
VDKDEELEYLIDVPGDSADLLLNHLKKYKLRRTKVKIDDVSDQLTVHSVYGTLNQRVHLPVTWLPLILDTLH